MPARARYQMSCLNVRRWIRISRRPLSSTSIIGRDLENARRRIAALGPARRRFIRCSSLRASGPILFAESRGPFAISCRIRTGAGQGSRKYLESSPRHAGGGVMLADSSGTSGAEAGGQLRVLEYLEDARGEG